MDKKLIIAQPRLWLEEPHNCTDAKDVLTIFTSFFDPLVAYDAQMNYVPALAESWVVSDDARTWTFTLRPNVTFHDGQPMDAEAVVYSLSRMARPDMGVTLGAPGVYNQYLAGMELEILNQYALRLTLKEPIADLLDILVTGFILPPDAVEQLGNQFKDTPIGTGPFEFVEHEEGVCIRAVKNHNYFHPLPDIDAIEWRLASDPDERLRMIREGRAHIAAGPPYTATLEDGSLNSVNSRGSTVYIIIFNTKSRFLEDPRVRLALNLAVDRHVLIDTVLNGAGYPLSGFIGPVHCGYDADQPPIPYDPGRARALLKEAGYSHGLSLTLDTPTSLPNEAVRLSNALSEQLSRIGVEISLVYTEDRELYANKVRRKEIHDMCVFDSSPLSTFRVLKEKVDARFAGSWWQGYHNADVEKLLDLAQSTIDNSRRQEMYKQCFRLLNQDPPWLYLYNYMNITCRAPQFSSWQPPAHGVIDPRYVK
ncbi:MAG: peptide ABC transporter substrate-binding protein [Desulfobacterales bacterium]|nr:peptide ABC transporter substrate-binding protein [Desulfobacterales bacterium]